jgi:formylglycine-generating enzyme required for sulfatase activity
MIEAFIPAGEFLMGSLDDDPFADPDERPAHLVYLDSYWIDISEVTNGQFLACVAAGVCTPPRHSFRYGEASYRGHPVLGVALNQAAAYCAWAGRRLPTEAEWERAARGTDGRLYPWGNQLPDGSRANFSGIRQDTAAVGSFPAGASPYGALDMAGNAWEWVSDAYEVNYYAESPSRNPSGGESANQFVIRGGSWTAGPTALRSANRFWAYPRRNDTDGFRCAQSDRLR